MRKLLLGLLLLASGPAWAQSNFTMPPPAGVVITGAQVVATCGTGTLAATQGFITVDTTGALCTGSTVAAAVTQGTSPWIVSNPIGITPTDRTITSASGASQQIAAALATRHSLTIQNTGNANCGVNPTGGTAAIGGAGTLTLAPLGTYSPRVPTLSAVTVICTAGQPIFGSEN